MDTPLSSFARPAETTPLTQEMRIVAVGDIHMAADCLHRIESIGAADLLLINGDMTNFGGPRAADQIITTAMAANANVLAQMGNLDKPEINDYLEKRAINLHGQARLAGDRVCLMGVGGSNRTPFNTPTEFSESELATFARNGYEQAKRCIARLEPVVKFKLPLILISHTPPYNTGVDRLRDGRHVGSTAIRTFIEDCQPDLCICGHIHEAAGSDRIGRTLVCNPGMLRYGGWLDIIVNNSTVTATVHDRF